MKITLMRDNDGATTMRTLDINLQIEAMKHETKAQPVTNLRTSIRYASPDYRLDEAKKLAKVIPAATFRKTVNGIQMTGYNGIIQIEINHLANRAEVNRVKQEAAELSQTFLAFMGSGGHSVKIWIRFTRPDQSLPQKREEAEIFQAHAYRKAFSLYQPALSYPIELKIRHRNNSVGKRMIRNFITTPILPSFICASHWKCLQIRLTRKQCRQKHPHSND